MTDMKLSDATIGADASCGCVFIPLLIPNSALIKNGSAESEAAPVEAFGLDVVVVVVETWRLGPFKKGFPSKR